MLIGGAVGARAGSRVRVELGPVYEFTNLIYRASDRTYLGTVCDSLDGASLDSCLGNAVFSDTLIVSSTPQSAAGALARLTFSDTLSDDRYYWLQPELAVQQKLVTAQLYGAWRWAFSDGAVAGLTQRFDHTLDQRFGYTRRVDTEALTGSVGYRSTDRAWALDLRPSAQLDRTNGSSALYIQDSNSGRLALSASHLAESGQLADLDAYWGSRAYPDSALRNYREAYAQLRLSQPLPGGFHSLLSGSAERRSGPSSELRNDLFSRLEGEADFGWLGLDWGARAHALFEQTSYARPSTVFYDSHLLRGDIAVNRTLSAWDLELRPRLERLGTPEANGEAYRQASLAFNATRARGGFLDLTLEAGRRHYTDPSATATSDTSGLYIAHSDYHYYAISILATQPLITTLSLRGAFDFTTEVHDQPEDNNHILYLNTELTYSFWLFGK